MKKIYISPTVEMLVMGEEENLLAGSPGVHEEYSSNSGYSRSLDDFADEADELTTRMSNLLYVGE